MIRPPIWFLYKLLREWGPVLFARMVDGKGPEQITVADLMSETDRLRAIREAAARAVAEAIKRARERQP